MIAGNPCFVAVAMTIDEKGEHLYCHYVFFDEEEAKTTSTAIAEADEKCVGVIVYPGTMFTPAVKQ